MRTSRSASRVVVLVAGLVDKDVLGKGRVGKERRGTLPVGEDVEAAVCELAEQLRRPAAPVEADRRAGSLAEELANAAHDLFQLARQASARRRLPDQKALAEAVRDVGVHLGRHGDAHAGEVGLRQLALAVVGADVTVDVEEPDRLGAVLDMAAGGGHLQVVGPSLGGELGHASPQPADLGRPVEADEPADGDRVEAGEAFGAGLAEQAGKDDRQHECPDAVEGGTDGAAYLPPGAVDRLGGIEKAGGGERRQDHECAGEGEVGTLADHRLGLGDQSFPCRLSLGRAVVRLGEWFELALRRLRRGCLFDKAGGRPLDAVQRDAGEGGDLTQLPSRRRSWRISPTFSSVSTEARFGPFFSSSRPERP